MKIFIYAFIWSLGSPLLAEVGGSWGGGTPPAAAEALGLMDLNESRTLPQDILDKLPRARVPQVRAQSFIRSSDGYTLIPLSFSEGRQMLRQVERKGSAGLLVDSGQLLKFVYLDGHLEEVNSPARIVMVDEDDGTEMKPVVNNDEDWEVKAAEPDFQEMN